MLVGSTADLTAEIAVGPAAGSEALLGLFVKVELMQASCAAKQVLNSRPT
jgi:hypothetical protein